MSRRAAAAGGDSWQRGGWRRWLLRRHPCVAGGAGSGSKGGGWDERRGGGWDSRWMAALAQSRPRCCSHRPRQRCGIARHCHRLGRRLGRSRRWRVRLGNRKAIVSFTSSVTNASRLFLRLRLRDPFPLPPCMFPRLCFSAPRPPPGRGRGD